MKRQASQSKEVPEMDDMVKDPVCGMMIRPADAAATEDHEGRTFHFCSQGCHDRFVNDPHRYGHPDQEHGGHGTHGQP
jgi:Cu+-exporting ATPase